MYDYERDSAEVHGAGGPSRKREPSSDQRNLAFASAAGNRAIQRLLDGSNRGGSSASETLEREIEEEQGGGDELSPDARARTEEALDEDFSDVRVHHDERADDLSRAVGATAFTTGNDIFFKSGAYDPDSGAGQKLLAHELTHVFQQRTAGAVEPKISEPTDASEVEAEHSAEAIAQGGPAPTVAAQPAAGISRDEDEEDELEGLEDQMSELAYDVDSEEESEEEEE